MKTNLEPITLTIHEAAWLRDALNVASKHYAKQQFKEGMSAWTSRFAMGLEAKIQEAKK
jgi:hypothetical protein